MTNEAITALETLARELDLTLTAPADRECLTCYLLRMTGEFGCHGGLRWVGHWRDRNAPRAAALERRLRNLGGYCDCEVLLNAYPHVLPEDHREPLAPCLGVRRRGSTQPCRPARRASEWTKSTTDFMD